MKTKFMAALLALVMVVSLVPMSVFAATDEAVAQIGDVTYTTLKAAVEAAEAGATVKVLSDVELSNTLTIPAGKEITLDLNGNTISGICNAGSASLITVNNTATLNIKDSSEEADGKITYAEGTSNVGWTIYLAGNLNLYSGTIELTGSWSIGYAVDARPNSWGTEYTEGTVFHMYGGKIISSDGAIRVASTSADGGAYPIHKNVSATFIMDDGSIEAAWDGIFIQQSNTSYDILSVNINGGTIASALSPLRFYGPAATSVVNNEKTPMNVTITGGVFDYTGSEELSGTWLISKIIKIGGGVTPEALLEKANVAITGGTFDADPTEYVADGYTATKYGSEGSEYWVVNKVREIITTEPDEGAEDETIPAPDHDIAVENVDTKAEEVVITPTVSDEKSEEEIQQIVDDLQNTANTVTTTGDGTTINDIVNTSATTLVTDQNVQEKVEEFITDQNDGVADDDKISAAEVTVVVVPALEVEITDYTETSVDAGEETEVIKTIEFEIEPTYEVIAVNNKTGEEVTIQESKPLEVKTPVVITMEIPAAFALDANGELVDAIYVEHVKKDEHGIEYARFVYTGEVSEAGGKYYLTFTNPNGFSTFIINTRNSTVASIGNVGYTSLQEAIDAAVSGDVITLVQDAEGAVISAPITFTLTTNGYDAGSITALDGLVLTKNGDTYTVIKNYSIFPNLQYVNLKATEGGTISGNKNNVLTKFMAALGSRRTIYITPDEGYEIVDVIVNGKSIGAVESFRLVATKPNNVVKAIFAEIDD